MINSIQYLCNHCGSDNILHLTWSRWNNILHCFEMVEREPKQRCGACDATFNYLQPTPATAKA